MCFLLLDNFPIEILLLGLKSQFGDRPLSQKGTFIYWYLHFPSYLPFFNLLRNPFQYFYRASLCPFRALILRVFKHPVTVWNTQSWFLDIESIWYSSNCMFFFLLRLRIQFQIWPWYLLWYILRLRLSIIGSNLINGNNNNQNAREVDELLLSENL